MFRSLHSSSETLTKTREVSNAIKTVDIKSSAHDEFLAKFKVKILQSQNNLNVFENKKSKGHKQEVKIHQGHLWI
jgi:hypothetical protein